MSVQTQMSDQWTHHSLPAQAEGDVLIDQTGTAELDVVVRRECLGEATLV